MAIRSFLVPVRLLAVVAVAALCVASAVAAPSVVVRSGNTRITMDSSFTTLLSDRNLTLKVSGGASKAGNRLTFPVVTGALDRGTTLGEIVHRGELKLTGSGQSILITGLTLDTTGITPLITGLVTVNGSTTSRIAVFKLILSIPATPIPLVNGRFTIPAPTVTIADDAGALFDSTFFLTDFTGGLAVGSGRVKGVK